MRPRGSKLKHRGTAMKQIATKSHKNVVVEYWPKSASQPDGVAWNTAEVNPRMNTNRREKQLRKVHLVDRFLDRECVFVAEST